MPSKSSALTPAVAKPNISGMTLISSTTPSQRLTTSKSFSRETPGIAITTSPTFFSFTQLLISESFPNTFTPPIVLPNLALSSSRKPTGSYPIFLFSLTLPRTISPVLPAPRMSIFLCQHPVLFSIFFAISLKAGKRKRLKAQARTITVRETFIEI